MIKKYKGILLYSKIYKENDLLIKFLSDTDELITGIVYGGLSKKKRTIYQVGFFINFNVSILSNKPPSINGELAKPYFYNIINDKFKLNCLLSTTAIINLSIIEGQKINNIYNISEKFLSLMNLEKNWLISHINFLFNLLKIIGYEIDYLNHYDNKYFDLESLEFTKYQNKNSIIFPFEFFDKNNFKRVNFEITENIFLIFETVFIKNHLSNLNLHLPNQYHLFKKLILSYLKTHE